MDDMNYVSSEQNNSSETILENLEIKNEINFIRLQFILNIKTY